MMLLASAVGLLRPPSLRPRGTRPCMAHPEDWPESRTLYPAPSESQTLYPAPSAAGPVDDVAIGAPACWWSRADAAGPLQWGSYIVHRLPHLRDALEQCLNDEEELETRLAEYDAELQQATDYLRPSAKQKVRLALEVALLAHHGQKRRSGEPYITHPVAVAVILGGAEMHRGSRVNPQPHPQPHPKPKPKQVPRWTGTRSRPACCMTRWRTPCSTSPTSSWSLARPCAGWSRARPRCPSCPRWRARWTPSPTPPTSRRRTCAPCSSRWPTTGASSSSSWRTGCTTCAPSSSCRSRC